MKILETPVRPPMGSTRLRWFRLLLAAVIIFTVGAYLGASGKVTRVCQHLLQKVELLRSQKLALLNKAASGMLAESEHLLISIKFKNYQQLVEQRDRAIAAGILTVTDEDYVPAVIEHAGNSIPVKIRLKGDLSDHFAEGEKWSFRVKTRGEYTLFGMKQFSLHHPSTRNYLYEWLFQHALIREGVAGLRYEFVRVTLNGRSLGVYALEEHFEKRLIENNRRREGPIVRFSEERLWQEWQHQKIPFNGARQNGSGSFLAGEVDAFQSGRWAADSDLSRLHDKAISLLRAFQRGELPTSDVFDIDRMATFLAVTDLMGAEHGARWHNTRFYYNPVTSRLEPIGFDGDAGKPISFLCIHMKDRHWSYNAWSSDPTYFARLFQDEKLVEKYLSELQRVSQPAFVESLLTELRAEITRNLRIIYSEDPSFEFSPETFYRNQRYIRSVIEPVAPLAGYFRLESPTTVELRLGNLQALPVKVWRVSDGQTGNLAAALPHGQLTLPGRSPTQLVDFMTLQVELPDEGTWDSQTLGKLRVQYRIPGVDAAGEIAVVAWPFVAADALRKDVVRRPSNAADFEFIEVDDAAQIIHIKPGDWSIAEDLILPSGYVVRCGSGTRLHLSHDAMFLSFSPVELIGSEDAPIIIDSPDATGQGFTIMTAHHESTLEYVVFQSLVSPSRDGWSLTGAVTSYESPVRISHCQFKNNSAEDSLNIIRTTFSVTDSAFQGGPSDALDTDFCRGEISRSTFTQPGNDAIDVSGSTVQITSVATSQTGDKGISVGERSQVDASDISIDRARIGVAVKDSSTLVGNRIRVHDSQVGLALYRKKPEFGPASAELKNFQLTGVRYDHLVESQSKVTIDEKSVSPNATQLARRLEPVELKAPAN